MNKRFYAGIMLAGLLGLCSVQHAEAAQATALVAPAAAQASKGSLLGTMLAFAGLCVVGTSIYNMVSDYTLAQWLMNKEVSLDNTDRQKVIFNLDGQQSAPLTITANMFGLPNGTILQRDDAMRHNEIHRCNFTCNDGFVVGDWRYYSLTATLNTTTKKVSYSYGLKRTPEPALVARVRQQAGTLTTGAALGLGAFGLTKIFPILSPYLWSATGAALLWNYAQKAPGIVPALPVTR